MNLNNTKFNFLFAWLNSRRIQYVSRLTFLFFGMLVLLRLSFYIYFGSIDGYLDASVFLQAFYIGSKFDFRLAILAVLPILFLELIPNPFKRIKNITRFISHSYFVLVFSGTLLIYILDFGYYAYLTERINAVALQFLDDAAISAGMVWQSYPVIWIGLAFLLAIAIFNSITRRYISPTLQRPYQPLSKFSRIFGSIIFGLLIFVGLLAKFSWYPLRWSDAFFSNVPFANSMAVNPVIYFYDTMKSKQQDYDAEKAKHFYPVIAEYLGVDTTRNASLDYSRQIPAKNLKTNPPNIIYVILESFGSNQYGLFGNALDSSPNLDKLGEHGLVFSNFSATTSGNTARSVFTAMTGIPDVSTKTTASHNPLIVDQHLIMNEFDDYEKYYFLGGSANWRNIRGFLTHNVQDLNLYEEGAYTEKRVDTWGISDLSLFREASKVFNNRQSKKPFIAVIQTSANHRPYTIPDDNDGFVIKPLPKDKIERQGFKSQGRYNAVRLLDHSVGQFIKMIENEDYFDNTIFIFHGDHGSSSIYSPHMPKAYYKLGLGGFMVPLIIYSPQLIPAPKRIIRPASEVDVFPMIAGLAGIAYTNKTLGRDLLDPSAHYAKYAPMISNFRPEGLRGVMGERFLLWRDVHDKVRLHDMQSEHPGKNVKDLFPDVTKKMLPLGDAMFETARYMLHHNSSLK